MAEGRKLVRGRRTVLSGKVAQLASYCCAFFRQRVLYCHLYFFCTSTARLNVYARAS